MMPEVFYVQCSECGHEFEIVTTEDELLADGFTPLYADPVDGYVFQVTHGDECEAALIIHRDDIPDV